MKLLINVSSFRVYFLQIFTNSLRDSLFLYFPSKNNHSYSIEIFIKFLQPSPKNDVIIPKILLILEDNELERYTDM